MVDERRFWRVRFSLRTLVWLTVLAGAILGLWVRTYYRRQRVQAEAARVQEKIRSVAVTELAKIKDEWLKSGRWVVDWKDELYLPDVFVMSFKSEIIENYNKTLVDLTVMARIDEGELGRIWIVRRDGYYNGYYQGFYNKHLVDRLRVALGAAGYSVSVDG